MEWLIRHSKCEWEWECWRCSLLIQCLNPCWCRYLHFDQLDQFRNVPWWNMWTNSAINAKKKRLTIQVNWNNSQSRNWKCDTEWLSQRSNMFKEWERIMIFIFKHEIACISKTTTWFSFFFMLHSCWCVQFCDAWKRKSWCVLFLRKIILEFKPKTWLVFMCISIFNLYLNSHLIKFF